MATWQEIGQDNTRAAIALYDGGYYRNATSRFYYATFSLLTHELLQRGARPAFRDGRGTPGHAQMSGLIRTYFTHMSSGKLDNLIAQVTIAQVTIAQVTALYLDRLDADYSLLRVDKKSSRASYRTTIEIFDSLGVPL